MDLRLILAVLLATIGIIAGDSSLATAASGDLDPSFGGDGRVLTDFGGNDGARAVVIDSQGRIIAAGSGAVGDSSRPGSITFSLARYTPSGELDPSFGGDGTVQSDFGDTLATIDSVGIDQEGRILAVGTTTAFDGIGSAIALARFLPDGSPDPSFGTGGQVETRLGLSGASDAAIEGDGSIVVAGTSQADGPLRPTVLRYLPDGTLDPAFGEDGIRTIRLRGFSSFRTLALSSAGRIALIGDTSSPGGGHTRFVVVRLLSSGANDGGFGRNGRVRILRGAPVAGGDLVADGRGGLVLAGSCSCLEGARRSGRFIVARLQPDGDLRGSFGNGGVTSFGFGGPEAEATSLALDAAGRIIVGGDASHDPAGGWAVARLTSEGVLDRSFGKDGRASSPAEPGAGPGGVAALALTGGGTTVAVGRGPGPTGTDFEVRRYLP